MNCTNLPAEEIMIHDGMEMEEVTPDVIRDKNGVPEEWTLLHTGENPFITAEGVQTYSLHPRLS